MKITRCKLSNQIQIKLLEFFVFEITASSVADLLGIHRNSVALFYHKIRLAIEYHLNLEACELFDGEIELNESYFNSIRKGKCSRDAT